MDLQLKGKCALITGSTAGIGYAIAQALATEGADVIVNGRSQQSVEVAIAKLTSVATGKVSGFVGDISNHEAAEDLKHQYHSVDILVNNLGIYEAKAFEEITDEDWLRFFKINVLSGIRLSRLYLPEMNVKNWGRIIFISSDSGIQIPDDMLHYGMTKAAQIAVARGLAELVSGTRITVNSVLPGPTRSRGVNDFISESADKEGKSFETFEESFFERVRPTSLIKRFTSPEEIASMVAYIASPLASATTGSVLRAEGGVIKSAF